MRTIKAKDILDTESFGEGNRHYFMDIKKTTTDKHYLRITRSDYLGEGNGYDRSTIILFEDDLHFFVEGLTMLLGRLSHQQLASAC